MLATYESSAPSEHHASVLFKGNVSASDSRVKRLRQLASSVTPLLARLGRWDEGTATRAAEVAAGKAYYLAGNIVKTIDAKNAETLCSFDARHRQVQCTNLIGSVTQWSYDANGNLLSLLDGDNHDGNGDATLYTYDSRNLKTSEAFPGHGPTSSIGDADFDLVAFAYDAAA